MALGLLLFSLLFLGCARAPIQNEKEALRPAGSVKSALHDDLELQGLGEALRRTIDQLEKTTVTSLAFGEKQVSKDHYIRSLKKLLAALDQDTTGEAFLKRLGDNFEVYEVYGTDRWSQVFITSYYSPRLKGSLKETEKFSMPLYGAPRDMVTVDLSAFSKANPAVSYFGQLRARVDEQLPVGVFVKPYWSREEIDKIPAKKFAADVLCYVDPIDGFFLQIQGSGQVDLPNGKSLTLNYANQNGHPYYAIGKALTDHIPLEQMSMQSIEAHLRKLPPEEQKKILNLNPSYVFFQKSDQPAVTSFGVSAVPGRTIATDDRYFPKGALGFLKYPLPGEKQEVRSRFVLNHDSGGAIKGPGRVDLYWGDHIEAMDISGRLKGSGELYFFVPKDERSVAENH